MSTKKVGKMLGYDTEGQVHREIFDILVMSETQTKTMELTLDPPGSCTVERLSLPRPVQSWWVWNSRTSVAGGDGNPHSCFVKQGGSRKSKLHLLCDPDALLYGAQAPNTVYVLQGPWRGFS